jgi:RNA polymerase sigma factor (sigma-70 family)
VEAHPSDDELLQGWRGGDRRAARVLIERYTEDLLRFFRGKVSGDVEDLIQQTLIGCVNAADSRSSVDSFRAYLFGVARHRLIDHYRQHRRRPIDPLEHSLADLGTSPSAKLAERDERSLLFEALRTIPLDLQIVLELYYWEHLSASELAGVLELPEGTVRSRIRRAKELLRRQIGILALSPVQRDRTLENLEARIGRE